LAKDDVPTSSRIGLLLTVSSLGSILAPLNSTMVAVALPDIREEFSLSHGTVAWLVSGYLIVMAVVQPIGGRLGDQLGRERVYRTGLVAFLALAVGASFAPNFAALATMRIAQAAAGAVLIPNGMAMLRTHAPPSELGRVNGMNGSVLSAAAATGPLLGAAVLAVASWRWIFPISVPFIVAALVLLPRLRLERPERIPATRLDLVGTALFVALLAEITFALGVMNNDLSALQIAGLWAGAVAIAALFVWHQRTAGAPAAEWRLFRVPSFAAATAYTMLTNLTMYTTLLMIPFFVREVLNRSTALSGLLLGAMSVLVSVIAPFGGLLSDEWGRRQAAQLGGVLTLAGAAVLAVVLSEDVPVGYLAACLALMGLGLGLGVGAANTAAIEAAPRSLAGSAAGTSSMMRYAGSIVGAGVLAGVLGSEGGDVAMFRIVALTVAATAALALVASMFIHRFAHVRHDVLPDAAIEAV
jgi:EmrB/QacA subfamily drug resistance transporter